MKETAVLEYAFRSLAPSRLARSREQEGWAVLECALPLLAISQVLDWLLLSNMPFVHKRRTARLKL